MLRTRDPRVNGVGSRARDDPRFARVAFEFMKATPPGAGGPVDLHYNPSGASPSWGTFVGSKWQ